MIRQCVISTTDVQAVKRGDGSWTVEGVEAEQFVDTILIMERWARPFNSTFYVTLSPQECINRLINNESDFTNFLAPLDRYSPSYHAPVTAFAGKNQFVTGFNSSEKLKAGREMATVFTNFGLLSPEIYLWSLAFIFSVVLFVFARMKLIQGKRSQTWIQKLMPSKVIIRELKNIVHHSSVRFKLMTFLFVLFGFYAVTCFNCVYKTSHVVAEKQDFPRSYKESLDHATSLAKFYDQFVMISDGFRYAPPGCLKRKLWSKLLASGSYKNSLVDLENTSPTALPPFVKAIARGIVRNKDIVIASSVMIALMKTLICGFSPDGELWFLEVFTDPSENEIIYGYAMTRNYHGHDILVKTQRRSFESHITNQHYHLSTDVTHIANRLAGTSKRHHFKQKLACSFGAALIPTIEVHRIPLSYFHSFFAASMLLYIVAIFVNVLEMLIQPKKQPSRRRRRRRGPRRRQFYFTILSTPK